MGRHRLKFPPSRAASACVAASVELRIPSTDKTLLRVPCVFTELAPLFAQPMASSRMRHVGYMLLDTVQSLGNTAPFSSGTLRHLIAHSLLDDIA
eukprot:5504969-Pleurochrysis_carterae.AAC.2